MSSGPIELSSAFFRSVADASPDCIRLLTLDGRVQYINGRGQALFGIPLDPDGMARRFTLSRADQDLVGENLHARASDLGRAGRLERRERERRFDFDARPIGRQSEENLAAVGRGCAGDHDICAARGGDPGNQPVDQKSARINLPGRHSLRLVPF